MKKAILAAGVVAAVLLAAGYFVVMPMMAAKTVVVEEDEEEEIVATPVKRKPNRNAEPGLTYTLPDRVLNLAVSGGTLHYARVELVLEFEKSEEHGAGKKKEEKGEGEAKGGAAPLDPALEPVAARKVMIDDLIIRVLGAKTKEQISSPEGQEALKAEILDAVSELVPKPQVTAVYITRLMVQ